MPSFSCHSEKSIKRQNITCNEKNYTTNTIRRSTTSTAVRMTMVTKLHEEECDNDRTRIRKMGPTTTIMGVTMSGKWDQWQLSWVWQCLGAVTHQVAVPGNLVCCTGQVKKPCLRHARRLATLKLAPLVNYSFENSKLFTKCLSLPLLEMLAHPKK